MTPEVGQPAPLPEFPHVNDAVEVFKDNDINSITKGVMTENAKKICPKHNTEMAEVKEYIEVPVIKDGYETDEMEEQEIVFYECNECTYNVETDQMIEQYYMSSDSAEISKKIEERVSDPDKQEMKTTPYSIIDVYAPKLSEIAQCQMEVSRAIIKFHISAQLYHLKVETSMGKIMPNLAYLWIAPSGVGKDPVIVNGIMSFNDLLVEEDGYREYNEITGPEYVRSVSTILSKKTDKNERIKTLNIWNEISTFAKLSSARGTNTGIETLNQALDGRVQGRATINRAEDSGSNVYCMMFGAGTTTFLKYISDDFFDLGLATRVDILPYQPPEIHDLQPEMEKGDSFKEALKIELQNIRDTVKSVNWRPDMWDAFNEYRKKILTEIRQKQMTIQESLAEENYEYISRNKFVKVLKHALVHAISRHNYTESGIVYVELPDLNNAIGDLEKHHTNLMELYHAWKEYDWKDMAEANVKKFIRVIENSKERYTVTSERDKDVDVTRYYFKPCGKDEGIVNGKKTVVSRTYVSNHTHLKAEGYGSLNEVEKTLQDRRKLGIYESSEYKHLFIWDDKTDSYKATLKKFYILEDW